MNAVGVVFPGSGDNGDHRRRRVSRSKYVMPNAWAAIPPRIRIKKRLGLDVKDDSELN